MKTVTTGLILFALVIGGWFGLCKYKQSKAITESKQLLQSGFPTLAFEKVKSMRPRMAENQEDCIFFIQSSMASNLPYEISLAAETCAEKKYLIKEIPIALATANSLRGNINEAINIIRNNLKNFEQIPDLYYSLAKLYIMAKNIQGAGEAFLLVLQKAPQDLNLTAEAFVFFVQNQIWNEAAKLATILLQKQDLNIELKLLSLRSFLKAGLSEQFKLHQPAIKSSLSTLNPNMVNAIQKEFSEELK